LCNEAPIRIFEKIKFSNQTERQFQVFPHFRAIFTQNKFVSVILGLDTVLLELFEERAEQGFSLVILTPQTRQDQRQKRLLAQK